MQYLVKKNLALDHTGRKQIWTYGSWQLPFFLPLFSNIGRHKFLSPREGRVGQRVIKRECQGLDKKNQGRGPYFCFLDWKTRVKKKIS
jgi:hypothetical protein